MNRRRWLILAAALLLAAAIATGLWFWQRGTDTTYVTITLDGAVIAEYDLSRVQETTFLTVGEPGAENTIRISPEGIAVVRADCPDQVCVAQGVHAHGPQPIVCLPHKLSITFSESTSGDAVDAVAGQ